VQGPAPKRSPTVAGGLSTRRRTDVDEVCAPAILRSPGSTCVAQNVEAFIEVVPLPIILAVDKLGLWRMELQSTLREPLLQLLPQALRLRLRLTVANRVIGIAFERDVRMVPRHPHSERVMSEEVRQQRAADPALGCPLPPSDPRAVGPLHGGFQPPLDGQPHPWAVGVLLHRPQHELVVNGVKEALDVEIEHPVIAPTTFARLTDGLDR
jgi:hypothetical protein